MNLRKRNTEKSSTAIEQLSEQAVEVKKEQKSEYFANEATSSAKSKSSSKKSTTSKTKIEKKESNKKSNAPSKSKKNEDEKNNSTAAVAATAAKSTKRTTTAKKAQTKSSPVKSRTVENKQDSEVLDVEDEIDKMLKMETMGRYGNAKVKDTDENIDELLEEFEDDCYDASSDEYKPENSSESDLDDFEEVEMMEHSHLMPKVSKNTIQITVDNKKSKKAVDRAAQLERMRKTQEKKYRIMIHKTHLVCWITHGFYLNKICRSPMIRALMLSIEFKFKIESFQLANLDAGMLLKLVKNINEAFSISKTHDFAKTQTLVNKYSITKALESMRPDNYLEYLLILLIALRNLNIKARLCLCFDTFPLKENTKGAKSTAKNTKSKASKKEEMDGELSDEETKKPNSKSKAKPTITEKKKLLKKSRRNSSKLSLRKLKDLESASEESEKEADSFEKDYKDIITARKSISNENLIKKKNKKNKKNDDDVDDAEMKSENESDEKAQLSENYPLNKDKKVNKNYKILSDDEILAVDSTDNQRFYWIEVYLNKEETWVPLEPVSIKLNQTSFFEKRFGSEILYVCAFDNENCMKDVTKRYSENWMESGRFCHITHFEEKNLWWEKICLAKQPLDADFDIKEEKQLKKILLAKPLPTSVSEYKDHPLYVLRRHLLKFQSIYPPNATPMGYFREEPVYSRDNLVTLHSKQTWLKFARVIKPAENAYKVVKGRLKRSEYKAGYRDNPDLDLFGFWQTQDYEPPRAYGGKVPRNEFGNVELFLPRMLPRGCVHLKLPNLNRVCRKLNIDCAAAVVGFDAHGGFSHAVYDGWVVCEEHKDTVIEAYEEEERRANLKLVQMHEEKVINNWKRLVKGLLIREKVKIKYGSFGITEVPDTKPNNKLKTEKNDEPKIDYSEADNAIKKLIKINKKSKLEDQSNKMVTNNLKQEIDELEEEEEEEEEEEKKPAAKKKQINKRSNSKKENNVLATKSLPKRQTRNTKPIVDNDDEAEAKNDNDKELDNDDFEMIKKRRSSNSNGSNLKKQKRFDFDLSNDSSNDSNAKVINKVDHDDLNLSEDEE